MSIIAVDVDLTVVDTLTPWMEWLESYTHEKVVNKDNKYYLDGEMREILTRAGYPDVDPCDYWRKPDLYDNLEPIMNSVLVLKNAVERGDIVIFVSSCFPEHIASKERFLNKFFPFHSGFIATDDKEYVGYDTIIDDRLKHMELGEKHLKNRVHILFTGLRKDGTEYQRMKYPNADSWLRVGRMLYPPVKFALAGDHELYQNLRLG